MQVPTQSRISATVLSSGLIVFSLLWFAAMLVFHVTNLQSKDGVFGAPVWTLLILVLVPLVTLILTPLLFSARRAESQQLKVVDYCALAAAAAPFAFVGGLILISGLLK